MINTKKNVYRAISDRFIKCANPVCCPILQSQLYQITLEYLGGSGYRLHFNCKSRYCKVCKFRASVDISFNDIWNIIL